MTLLALLLLAALTFSVLAGVMEVLAARRTRRRLAGKASPVLHPLTRHGLRRVRHPLSWRVLHHLGLFVGFLVLPSVAVLFVRAMRNAIANWL